MLGPYLTDPCGTMHLDVAAISPPRERRDARAIPTAPPVAPEAPVEAPPPPPVAPPARPVRPSGRKTRVRDRSGPG